MVNYYTVFGIQQLADDVAIKKRYRELSKMHHPDMGGSQEKMAEINEAFHVLSDSWRRSQHDRALRQEAEAAQAPRAASSYTRPVAPTQSPTEFMRRAYRPPAQPNPRVYRSPDGFKWRPVAMWLAVVAVALGTMIFAVYGQPIGKVAASPPTSADTSMSAANSKTPQTTVDTTTAPADSSATDTPADTSAQSAGPGTTSESPESTTTTPTDQSTDQSSPSTDTTCSISPLTHKNNCDTPWQNRKPRL